MGGDKGKGQKSFFKEEVSKVYEGSIEYIEKWLNQYSKYNVFK